MKFLIATLISFLASFLFQNQTFAAESIQGEHIQVSVLAPQQWGPGQSWFAFTYKVDPHWHIYWKNPGDSGSAPKFNFTITGAQVSEPFWPAPQRLPVGDLVNLGYEKAVTLPFQITPQVGASQIHIEVKMEWLVCNEEGCLPGFGTLALIRPVSAEEKWSPAEGDLIRQALARLPQKPDQSSWKIKSVRQHADEVVISVTGTGNVDPLDIFPTDGTNLRPQAPVKTKQKNGVSFAIKVQPGVKEIKSTGFVLSDGEKSVEWSDMKVSPVQFEATDVDLSSLLMLLLFSFVGGVLLNFMPCVLPVLTIKFLSISQTKPADRLKDALLYTTGVLLTFSVLGAVFLALRSAGASVGWGFQLQSPFVVLTLIVLFWLMALNFLGVFEFGTSVMNAAGRSTQTGSFATGILSVFIAAPCTGPFMGTALGAAATLPALESLAIFICLGLGLASPFVLVAVSPQARKLIPRPGAWMEKLKQVFAFPLFATVIWLLWVLHLQVGVDALPFSLGALLLISFALWLGRNLPRTQVLLWILCIVMLAYVGHDLKQRAESTSAASLVQWESFSPDKVAAARAQGRPVLIDFTAAWCITCQFNKKTVLKSSATEQLFKDKNVALFEADWTKQDPIITEALAQFGRNSVPLYLFYPAGSSEAKILPQILTPSAIEGIFK